MSFAAGRSMLADSKVRCRKWCHIFANFS